jgi:large subunit ribosomal protein L22
MGRVDYRYVHYFVRLEEGEPPKHFYLPHPMTPEEQLDKWMDEMRNRKVMNSL